MRSFAAWRWILGAAVLLVAAPFAGAKGIGGIISDQVRARYRELHRCYRKSLARDRSKGGTVFLKVVLGAGDRPRSVSVARDELGHGPTARCLEAQVRAWTFPGAAAAGAVSGSELYLPLTFRADPGQRSVAAADLGWGAKGGESVALLTQKNVGASGLEVWLHRGAGSSMAPARRGVVVFRDAKKRLQALPRGAFRRALGLAKAPVLEIRVGGVARSAKARPRRIRRRLLAIAHGVRVAARTLKRGQRWRLPKGATAVFVASGKVSWPERGKGAEMSLVGPAGLYLSSPSAVSLRAEGRAEIIVVARP